MAEMALEIKPVAHPDAGVVRVHHTPTLPRMPSDGRIRPRHRFDDPLGRYGVWYFASKIRGALLEVMDQFRSNAAAEEAINRVEGVEGVDITPDEPPGYVPEIWLASQLVVSARVRPSDDFVDINRAELLADLNDRARVKQILRKLDPTARLDEGTIRLGGNVGRAITQVVSREVYEVTPTHAGIAYSSRFDDEEECWAGFQDRIQVDFDDPVDLDSLNGEHRRGVQEAAELLNLKLPTLWRENA